MKTLYFYVAIMIFSFSCVEHSCPQNRITIKKGITAAQKSCLDVSSLFPKWVTANVNSIPTVYYNITGDSIIYLFEVSI